MRKSSPAQADRERASFNERLFLPFSGTKGGQGIWVGRGRHRNGHRKKSKVWWEVGWLKKAVASVTRRGRLGREGLSTPLGKTEPLREAGHSGLGRCSIGSSSKQQGSTVSRLREPAVQQGKQQQQQQQQRKQEEVRYPILSKQKQHKHTRGRASLS